MICENCGIDHTRTGCSCCCSYCTDELKRKNRVNAWANGIPDQYNTIERKRQRKEFSRDCKNFFRRQQYGNSWGKRI